MLLSILVCLTSTLICLTKSVVDEDFFIRAYTDEEFSGISPISLATKASKSRCASWCILTNLCKSFAYKRTTRQCILHSKCPDRRCDTSFTSVGWKIYCIAIKQKPRNCEEIRKSGRTCSGVYNIEISPGFTKDVYCEMTIAGGGWTVFQKRLDGSVDFYRPWADYKIGFGLPSGEYWMGNDALHLLSNQYSINNMFIYMEDWNNAVKSDIYTNFRIGDEAAKYRLQLTASGGDTLTPCLNDEDPVYDHNNMAFSTYDVDNDLDTALGEPCASYATGAWWYNSCLASNLNGRYLGASATDDHSSNSCHGFGGDYRALKTVMMMMKGIEA